MAKAGINAEKAGKDDALADEVLVKRFTAQREQAAFAAWWSGTAR
jgi:hypothetical protein